MPLTGLPDNDESTLHTFPDGTSQFQIFPAIANAAAAFTPTLRWGVTTDEFIRDSDLVSIEVVGQLTRRPDRSDTDETDMIPIIMSGTDTVLQFNGCYKSEWDSSASYDQFDVVLYTDGIYYRTSGVAGSTEVPGVSNLWVPQTINRPTLWRAVNEASTSTAISGPNGLAPQIFISNGATLDLFNTRMEFVGALVGDDVEVDEAGGTAVAYTIRMHEVELYQGSPTRAGFFRVRPNALTSDSFIQSLILNGLTQGMYLYDPTSATWGTALDNLELTVLRGGIIMDGGSTPQMITLRDFDESNNLARADATNENRDAVYSCLFIHI